MDKDQMFMVAESSTTPTTAANTVPLMRNGTFWAGFGFGALAMGLVVTGKMIWSGWRQAKAAERAAAAIVEPEPGKPPGQPPEPPGQQRI